MKQAKTIASVAAECVTIEFPKRLPHFERMRRELRKAITANIENKGETYSGFTFDEYSQTFTLEVKSFVFIAGHGSEVATCFTFEIGESIEDEIRRIAADVEQWVRACNALCAEHEQRVWAQRKDGAA